MINDVRKTVLSILNKNNYGYVSPDDFNMYARVAQREVFENYFHQFNESNNKMNARKVGSEVGDIRERYQQAIDKFTTEGALDFVTATTFDMPSLPSTNDEAYLILDVEVNGVSAGKVSKKTMRALEASDIMTPSSWNPVYSIVGETIEVSSATPVLIAGNVVATYVRYPKSPKWTYLTFGNGEPLFEQTQEDYQDFEVDMAEETELINKILQMAGMSIREIAVVNQATLEEKERTIEQG